MQDQSQSDTGIEARLAAVRARIQHACDRSQRQSDDVALMAVSKRHSASAIEQAYALGMRSFGESFVQEAVDKIAALPSLDCQWHFIGRLQSNKLKLIARYFDWVDSVTSVKQLDKLSQLAQDLNKTLQICIQVKLGDEPSKSGVTLSNVEPLLEQASRRPHLVLRGLMAIPPLDQSDAQLQAMFERLSACYRQLQSRVSTVDTLSIGMSADLESAIAAGSTMVRIGTAIFGPRI